MTLRDLRKQGPKRWRCTIADGHLGLWAALGEQLQLRTTAAKRFKRVENATALIWKLFQAAESTFPRLKGAALLPPLSMLVHNIAIGQVARRTPPSRWRPDGWEAGGLLVPYRKRV